MHVGMYDCMRSESESELGRQMSSVPRKAYKQTYIPVSVYVYVYEEQEWISVTLVTTAAQACVSDVCMCVCARVCAGTISLILPMCLFGCRCTPWHKKNTHTQATLQTRSNTCQMINLSFVLKGGNTMAHPHKHTNQDTHVICGMSWKESGCTDVILLYARYSCPPCVGQEPVRTSGAPA